MSSNIFEIGLYTQVSLFDEDRDRMYMAFEKYIPNKRLDHKILQFFTHAIVRYLADLNRNAPDDCHRYDTNIQAEINDDVISFIILNKPCNQTIQPLSNDQLNELNDFFQEIADNIDFDALQTYIMDIIQNDPYYATQYLSYDNNGNRISENELRDIRDDFRTLYWGYFLKVNRYIQFNSLDYLMDATLDYDPNYLNQRHAI